MYWPKKLAMEQNEHFVRGEYLGVAPKVSWTFSVKGFKVGKDGFRVRTAHNPEEGKTLGEQSKEKVTFTEKEVNFLKDRRIAKIATVSPAGQPHVPVGFEFDEIHLRGWVQPHPEPQVQEYRA